MKNKIINALKLENIELSQEKIKLLEQFANRLMWYNKTHNITGAKDDSAVISNIIDSLVPIKFISKPSSLLDVGTGAGFPGLILAIIYSDIKVILAEPINKRASFLRLCAYELGLDRVEIFKNRVEKLKSQPLELITSRAVTNTKLLLDLTKDVSNSDTKYLFYKGERVFSEVDELNNQYIYDIVQKSKRNYLYIKGLK